MSLKPLVGCDFLFIICGFPENSEFQKSCWLQNIIFLITPAIEFSIRITLIAVVISLIVNVKTEDFGKWMDYHFTICDRQDLIGASHHTLDILQKE